VFVLVNRRGSGLNGPIDDGHILAIDEPSGPARDWAAGDNLGSIYKRHLRTFESCCLIVLRRRDERFADPIAVFDTAFEHAAILNHIN
jgi:hypothetical protein